MCKSALRILLIRLPAASENLRTGNRPVELTINGRLHYHSTVAGSEGNCSPHCLKPSYQKLLTPPPPPRKKSVIQFQGVRGLRMKKFIRGRIGQNNDFTRGWISNIMHWGMLRE